MFNNFAEVIEAAQARCMEIVNEIDRLTVQRQHLIDQYSEMIDALQLREAWWLDERVTPEQRKEISDCDDALAEIHSKIGELDDEKLVTTRFLHDFTDAVYKSKSIVQFMDYMRGITPAMRSGDAYDPFPNH